MANGRLKTRIFQFAEMRGINTAQLAQLMNVDPSYISRVKGGQRRIGATFIEGAKRAFPEMDFDALFYMSREEETETAAIAS